MTYLSCNEQDALNLKLNKETQGLLQRQLGTEVKLVQDAYDIALLNKDYHKLYPTLPESDVQFRIMMHCADLRHKILTSASRIIVLLNTFMTGLQEEDMEYAFFHEVPLYVLNLCGDTTDFGTKTFTTLIDLIAEVKSDET
jgi:hypothetical protein